MANLAIKGHPTRGKEVIEILKMLGGKNKAYLNGTDTYLVYYICSENYIDTLYAVSNAYRVFTLEEFLEKYPYKVGDKVNSPCKGCVKTITSMKWDNILNTVTYKLDNKIYTNIDQLKVINDLQSYKEETMENKPNLLQRLKEYFDNTPKDVLEKEWNELSYLNEIGPSIDEYLKWVKKYRLPKYPTTYIECCEVLNLAKYPPALAPNKSMFISQYEDFPHYYEIQKLAELLICRDAYWKIAGEQMGLSKPWEPDWKEKDGGYRYCIRNQSNKIILSNEWLGENYILSFPTAEMRDTFYENFKDLIEECKDFL